MLERHKLSLHLLSSSASVILWPPCNWCHCGKIGPLLKLNFYGGLCQSLVSRWEEALDNKTATGFWSAAVNKSTYENIINWYD